MACHALTNWATESFSNSVVGFEQAAKDPAEANTKLAGMFDGKGVASAKCEAQAQLVNMLQTWESDLNLVKVIERNKYMKADNDSGGDSNLCDSVT